MKAEDVKAFLASLESAQGLTPLDKISMKHKFFQQHIATDPEWATAPPEARMAFAKNYGISPGLAQIGEGEFMQRGLLPKPQGDLGEAQEPNMFLDPVYGLSGGLAALAGKAPFIGASLAARSPLIREAAKQGLLRSMADWQSMGLTHLPGMIGRGASALAQKFRGTSMPAAATMPGPMPAASQLFPIQGGSPVPPPPVQPAPHWLSPPPRSVPPTEP